MTKTKNRNRLEHRRAGVLLHPTSLPGEGCNGELGPDAYWFVDFLQRSGFGVWQTLPLAPTHADLSPYQAQSVHAGNTRLLSFELLYQKGYLKEPPPAEANEELRARLLDRAYTGFIADAEAADKQGYRKFIQNHAWWLEDYALFKVLKNEYDESAWWDWKPAYRDRDPDVLQKILKHFSAEIEQHYFAQYVFFTQWLALKRYANEKGVLLFGDLPIFIAADSVDVWAGRENFLLTKDGQPTVVAGVPPDYFSSTGQLWGNPHYDWEYMRKNGFTWWLQRLDTQKHLFDMVRIDHFRGFEAYWEIPAQAPNAITGHWVKAPGEKLFETLMQTDHVPLVAEDLGVITPEVTALRRKFHIPGMKILQFAFDGGADNPYLPHNHSHNYVIYTGTHDNDTSLGWFNGLDAGQRRHVCEYLGALPESMPWPLIRSAFASTARLAITPMQDLLACDSNHRMNRPGISDSHNWRWRFQWEDIPHDLHERLREMLQLYGRA